MWIVEGRPDVSDQSVLQQRKLLFTCKSAEYVRTVHWQEVRAYVTGVDLHTLVTPGPSLFPVDLHVQQLLGIRFHHLRIIHLQLLFSHCCLGLQALRPIVDPVRSRVQIDRPHDRVSKNTE